MKNIVINNLGDFVAFITKIKLDHDDILLFRGQPDSEFALIPALGRPSRNSIGKSLTRYEPNLIESAQRKYPNYFTDEKCPLNLLAKLQHFGIPTRLLDITSNAFVALYFACDEVSGGDGEVIVFKTKEIQSSNSTILNAFADTYRLANTSKCSIKEFGSLASKQQYFALSKDYFEDNLHVVEKEDIVMAMIMREYEKVAFVETPEYSERQKFQQGKLIIFPNKIVKDKEDGYCFVDSIEPIKKDEEHIECIIRIPKKKKSKVLLSLKSFGIIKENLFADSMDIVCEEIKNKF